MKTQGQETISSFEGLPRLANHPDLDDVATRETLMADARAFFKSGRSPRSRDAEETLFKAMHACACMMTPERDGDGEVTRKDRKRASQLYQRIVDYLVNSNLGLVYEMRRRCGLREGDEDEYASTGMWSLYQALLAFDPWRGYRFSTYACNAIIRGYRHVWKRMMRQRRHQKNFVEQSEQVEDVGLQRDADLDLLSDRLKCVLNANAAELTPTERFIIERRFLRPMANRPDTLESIGKLIRLSKERVRQIQMIALGKLRKAMDHDPVLRTAMFAEMN